MSRIKEERVKIESEVKEEEEEKKRESDLNWIERRHGYGCGHGHKLRERQAGQAAGRNRRAVFGFWNLGKYVARLSFAEEGSCSRCRGQEGQGGPTFYPYQAMGWGAHTRA